MYNYELKPNARKVYKPSDTDWLEVEGSIGFNFTEDYKSFIESYGAYPLADFIWILSPYEENEFLNLQKKNEVAIKAFTMMKNEIDDLNQYKLFSDYEGLYLFGLTENGDELYWYISNGTIATGIYVFESRSYKLEKFNCTFKDFIIGLTNRSIDVSFFPADLEY